jgi:hypothetical protein
MNDLDLLRPAARQRTSNGLRRPGRRRIAYTLTSNPFTVAPVSQVARPTSILTRTAGTTQLSRGSTRTTASDRTTQAVGGPLAGAVGLTRYCARRFGVAVILRSRGSVGMRIRQRSWLLGHHVGGSAVGPRGLAVPHCVQLVGVEGRTAVGKRSYLTEVSLPPDPSLWGHRAGVRRMRERIRGGFPVTGALLVARRRSVIRYSGTPGSRRNPTINPATLDSRQPDFPMLY